MPRVRVIGSDGEMIGVLSRDEALSMAEDEGLDLVEIQPQADPPVCKIMDFGKFKFEAQKKASEAKKKTKQVEIKEVKFRPVTDEATTRSSCARCAGSLKKATRSRSTSASVAVK